jgi:ABC-2 type transport system ATP-binding protein
MPTVSIHNVRKAFGAVQAVDGVSFEVEPGEIFGLLGPNGAGKTDSVTKFSQIRTAHLKHFNNCRKMW